MLFVSMPTGLFSMKLLYMVQAESKQKTHTHNKFTELIGCVVDLHVKFC